MHSMALPGGGPFSIKHFGCIFSSVTGLRGTKNGSVFGPNRYKLQLKATNIAEKCSPVQNTMKGVYFDSFQIICSVFSFKTIINNESVAKPEHFRFWKKSWLQTSNKKIVRSISRPLAPKSQYKAIQRRSWIVPLFDVRNPCR